MTKKIAVDLGNRNIKVCYRDNNKVNFISFQARFTDEEQLDYSTAEVIELDGIKYCIEQGEYDFEFNKTLKNYIPLLLCAISRVTSEEEIDLMIGAPAEHVSGLRDDFKEQLLGKTFKFKYKNENEERLVKINKLGVIGEGFSTYFAIPRDIKNSINNLAILDIGGRTINVSTFIGNKQDKVCTLNYGILDIKNDILKNMKKEGKDYNLNTIENMIDNNKVQITVEQKVTLIQRIINDIKMYKIDVDLYSWFVTGGGSIDIGSKLEEYFGKYCINENPLYSNVLGYYNFMVAKWGE